MNYSLSNISSYKNTFCYIQKQGICLRYISFIQGQGHKNVLIPSKVDVNATDFAMVINGKSKGPLETSNKVVHDVQHTTASYQIQFSPVNSNDDSTLSTGTSRSSTSHSKSLASVTPDKVHPSKNILITTGCPFAKISNLSKRGNRNSWK